MPETEEIRLKRLKIRSWRRGTKEMDLVLGPYFDLHGASMEPAELDLYEALLEENDQDLYRWVTEADPCPPEHTRIVRKIVQHFIDTRQG